MKLSQLQKFILITIWENRKNKISREIFNDFYQNKKSPSKKIRTNIITRSLERLIDRGLLIGYGEKTQHKLFITHAKLTSAGNKKTKQLLGQQTSFKFKK